MRVKYPLWELWERYKRRGKTHLSEEIYQEFEQYAKDTGFYLSQNALFRWMTEGRWIAPKVYQKPRYPKLTLGSFNYWFDRLVDEEYIAVDSQGRSVSSSRLSITEKDDTTPELDKPKH